MATGGSEAIVNDGNEEVFEWNCTVCEEGNMIKEAIVYCKECNKFFCRHCERNHDKYVRNHKVLGQEDKKSWGTTQSTILSQIDIECAYHTKQPVSLYCGYHDEVCCPLCALKSHSGNCRETVVPISSAASSTSAEDEYIHVRKDIRKRISKFSELEKDIWEYQTTFLSSQYKCKGCINDFVGQLINRIIQLQTESLAKTKDLYDEYFEKIKHDLHVCSITKYSLISLETQLDKLHAENDIETFIKMKIYKKSLAGYKEKEESLSSRREHIMSFMINEEFLQLFKSNHSLGNTAITDTRANEAFDTYSIGKATNRLTGNQNLQEHSPHRNAEAAGCTDNPSKVTSVQRSSRRDKGSSTVLMTDHGATGIEKSQQSQEQDDVGKLCDKGHDLIKKYEKKCVKFVLKISVIVKDSDNMFFALKTEFTSAVNKLKNNIIEDSLDVTDKFEQESDTDLPIKYEKQGVLVEFNRDTKQVKFYGTNWTDVQTVKQTVKLKLFPNCPTNERNRDFRTPRNPSADFEKQTNMSQHYVSGGHDQGARPKHKNTNISSNEVTNSNQQQLKKKYKIKTVDVLAYSHGILNVPVGCIVNAANCNLQHTGGVASVIADAAGIAFRNESENYVKTHGKLKVGEACRTSAGNLEYDHVIHTVGPCWSYYKPHHLADVRRCEDDLMNAIKNSLHCAESVCKKVAFTAISAGHFGCPLELCAVQYGKAVLEYIAGSYHPVKEIHFVDLNPDIVYQIKIVLSTIESTDNVPENYDSNIFVNQNPKLGKTSNEIEGRQAQRTPLPEHKKQGVPTSTAASHQYPHCLPATGLPTKNDTFTCFCSETKKLLVYAEDIFTMKADMMVCGESICGNGKGFLSNTLSDILGKKYQKAKERAFKSATHGNVIVCKAGSNSYKFIAHVVLPKRAEIDDEQKMTATFNKLLSLVKEKKCHSVALPLLGTGKGKVDTSYCAQILFRSMMNFCKNHPKYVVQIHLINIEPDKTNMIISTIQQCVGSMEDHHNTTPRKPTPPTRQPERHTQLNTTPEKISKSQTKKTTGIGKKLNQDEASTNRFSAREVCEETSDADADNYDWGFKTNKTSSVNDIESSRRTGLENQKKGEKQGNIQIIDDSPYPSDSVNINENDCSSLVLEDMEDSEESRQEEDTREDCVICMDEIKDPKVLPCGHKFCVDCIDAQFRYKEICPTCGAICGVITDGEDCVICLDIMTEPRALPCGHAFCRECLEQALTAKQACPTCCKVVGIITGDQPDGNMHYSYNRYVHCAGYPKCGTIKITYSMPPGRQNENHPNPGKNYKEKTRSAYLPGNRRGMIVLEMLRVAFDRKLVFTIGSSRTTGEEGVITWNDIRHKTNPKPYEMFGYPDDTYLDRVTDELKARGVTEKNIPEDAMNRIKTLFPNDF